VIRTERLRSHRHSQLAVEVEGCVVPETPIEQLEKSADWRLNDMEGMEPVAAIAWQIVQLREEVKAGISAVEVLRSEVRELHEQTRDELSRQAGETRQLILQTRQELRALQEHSVSRITSRLVQR
jgi:hypothetical protein